ncbi:hypothetical protein Hdeb2414_s0019g00539811 [Helianthus debilis subsp. tardiflorus]
MVDIDIGSDSWSSFSDWMNQYSNSRKLEHVVCKLVLAASAYFIWQERNNRLFSRSQCSAPQVSEKIKNSVRLRLMGFKFQGQADHKKVMEKWQIPLRALDEDPG